MLKPKYLEQLPDAMIELYSAAEMDILADMARRISTYDYWIPAAEWQYQKLMEMGNYHSFVLAALASRTKYSRAELEKLMREAGAETLRFDDAVYRNAGLDPPPLAASPALQKVLVAGMKKTEGLFRNLTKTTANTATKQFENALDRAYMQITSGAFDRGAAVRTAIKDLAKQGVGAITYPSGHVDTIEVAVRRAVVTGVNQTALKLQDARAGEMGCDLVETTAHAGARPAHAAWQGQIFSRSGKGYPDFASSTGYGSGAGLGGWNCRHSYYPYFEGMPRAYTDKMLQSFEDKSYTYNGHALTEYEATQQQRYLERQIRRWKRENVAMGAAGLDTTESAVKVRQWQDMQKDYLNQTGLKRQADREQIAGFGRKQAAQAHSMSAKHLKNPQNHATMKQISGARITNPEGEAAEAHAERYYGLVRSMKADVAAIAKNTGFSEADIQRIKDFIFTDKHDLGGTEPQRFSPDFAMAQSWQRLIDGKPKPHDYTLIHHETMEKKLMDSGLSQLDAHHQTNKKYDYTKESNDYYDSLKKHKDNG